MYACMSHLIITSNTKNMMMMIIIMTTTKRVAPAATGRTGEPTAALKIK